MPESLEIDAQLTNTIADLVQEKILSSINTDPAYAIGECLPTNSLLEWAPGKLYLYHGKTIHSTTKILLTYELLHGFSRSGMM
jgi:hypothetical protein